MAVIGSVAAFNILAPGLVNPNAIRWGSVIVFGGAGAAAVAGLILLVIATRYGVRGPWGAICNCAGYE